MAEISQRLEQLLLVLSYVRRHQGAPLGEVAEAVGLPPGALRQSIDMLSLCGKPPFNPDDLIDIWVDADDRVYVELDQALGRPLDLTQQESMALSIALETMAGSGAGAYADAADSALRKLRAALGGRVMEKDEVARRIAVEGEDPNVGKRFRVLHRGLEEERVVEIEYYSAARAQPTRRRLRPYGLVQFRGSWYAIGFDQLRGETRIFKLERMREVRLTTDRFVRPAAFDAGRYLEAGMLSGPLERRARLRFSSPAAQAIVDEWRPEQVAAQADGSVVLTLDFVDPEWVAGYALGFGEAAEVLDPPEVRRALAERCRAILRLYGS